MLLKVFSPTGVVLTQEITKIDAEALDGYWTLLPRHVDFVTALKPCIVTYHTGDGATAYVACNEGILVKKADTVSISTRLAVLDTDLGRLSHTIADDFKKMQQDRKEAGAAMARLELGLTKGFVTLRKSAGGLNGNG